MKLFEKILIKVFFKTFEKVYKMGMTDAFNFLQYFSSISHKNFMQ